MSASSDPTTAGADKRLGPYETTRWSRAPPPGRSTPDCSISADPPQGSIMDENRTETENAPVEALEAPLSDEQPEEVQDSPKPSPNAEASQVAPPVPRKARSATEPRWPRSSPRCSGRWPRTLATRQSINGPSLRDAADLWRDGLTVEELLDENGVVDPEKVRDAAKGVLLQHPHWGRRPAGLGMQAHRHRCRRPSASWQSVLSAR